MITDVDILVQVNNSIPIYIQQDVIYSIYVIWKLLYMFRVVSRPISRSVNNCIYSIWYLSYYYCYLPLAAGSSRWKYHPEHVEQFPDKINCVMLHLVGYILEYYYDAWTHDGTTRNM
jgi:hypothetical protein